jgi:hypothetical protein
MALSLERIETLVRDILPAEKKAGGKGAVRLFSQKHGSGHQGRFVHFAFLDGRSAPEMVIKSMCRPCFDEWTRAETRMLKFAAETLGRSAIGGTYPEVLFAGTIEESEVLIESFLDGKSGTMIKRGRGMDAVNNRAAVWLAEFQRVTRVVPGDRTRSREIAEAALADYAKSYSLEAPEREHLEALRADLPNWIGDVPLCAAHGDFSPVNVRLSGRTFRVIDWEFAAAEELPFLDAAMWIGSSILSSAGVWTFKDLRRRTVSPGRLRRFVSGEFLRTYGAASGIPADLVSRALPLGFIQIAVRQWRRDGMHGWGDAIGRYFAHEPVWEENKGE